MAFNTNPIQAVAGPGSADGTNALDAVWQRNLGDINPVGAVANPDGAFTNSLNGALTGVQNMQSHADNLAVKAASGRLENVHEYTIAATQAKLATELTVAIRNKAVEAFTEIMRMQA